MTSARGASGFTLIEMMITLLIIGIATAAVTLSLAPDPREALRRDARELALRLDAAQQEVRIDGRVIVWQGREDGYEFLRGTWVVADGHPVPKVSTAGALDRFEHDDLLRPRPWRSGRVHSRPAGPLLITSEWMSGPLTIELTQGNQTVLIQRSSLGPFQVQ